MLMCMFFVCFFNLFIHSLNTLHNQTKTNHQSQKGEEKNTYTNTQINQQINNTDKQTNRWTLSHGSACNLYSFVFRFFTCACTRFRACLCACSLHCKTLLTYHNLSFNQIFVEMTIHHKCII